MELHHRVELIETLMEEAAHKRTALTHVLNAKERVEQEKESTHGAPLTDEEEGLKYEHDLWQKVEIGFAEMRKVLDEIEQLERQRGLSQ
jgi:hypothetical protein